MNNRKLAQQALSLVAIIASFGVFLQLYISVSNAVLDGRGIMSGLMRYFAYFTVLANIFVVLVATMLAFNPRSKLGQWLEKPVVMGCVVTAILFVALAYHFLLRHVWHPEGLQLLANYVLHYVTPASLVVYWLVFPPKQMLNKLDPVRWTIFPVIYFIYALGRGVLGDTYPYYFIDVSVIGYGQTIINALVLCMIYIVLGALVLLVTKFRQAKNYE
jgi:hypothetical protein